MGLLQKILNYQQKFNDEFIIDEWHYRRIYQQI